MSSRQLRKVQGEPKLPPPDSEDEDFEPLYAAKKSNFVFKGDFGDVDHSNSNSDAKNSSDPESSPKILEAQCTKKKTKNRKKRGQSKKGKKPTAEKSVEDNDEVARSVREVNEILGEVPPPLVLVGSPKYGARKYTTLPINWRYLNSRYEKKKRFGYDVEEDENGGVKKKARNAELRFRKKLSIVKIDDFLNTFTKSGGLTMSVRDRDGPITFFSFDHEPEYQKQHREFLKVNQYRGLTDITPYLLRHYEGQVMHVEFWLEDANRLFIAEEYGLAESLLKRSIAYMQYVLHPSFVMDDPNVRLPYEILENRVYFEAILKYLHILTNTLCHRTALELCKLLLNLDPSDPMGILLVIDTIALRAMEHEWLVEAIEIWNVERHATHMANLKYSYALAKYHVLKKKGGDLSEATKLLRDAMIMFPYLLLQLLDSTPHKVDPRLQQHVFFTAFADSRPHHKELGQFYAKFAHTKWSEDGVLAWVQETAVQLVLDYDRDPEIQVKAATFQILLDGPSDRFRFGIDDALPDRFELSFDSVVTAKRNTYLLLLWECVNEIATRWCYENSREFIISRETSTAGRRPFYAKFAHTKCNEDGVVAWVQQTAVQLVLDYDRDPEIQKVYHKASTMRRDCLTRLPQEIQRHIYVIQPMKKILYNNALESLTPVTAPPNSPRLINRYNYPVPPWRSSANNGRSDLVAHVMDFVRTLAPNHLQEPVVPEDVLAIIRGDRPPVDPTPNAAPIPNVGERRTLVRNVGEEQTLFHTINNAMRALLDSDDDSD